MTYRRRALNRAAFAVLGVALVVAIGGGCADPRTIPTQPINGGGCAGYTPAASSPHVLPYEAGRSFVVLQGNCTNNTHQGADRYAYDFQMPLGSPVHAIRDGIAVFAVERFPNDDASDLSGNTLAVLHDDDTLAVYVHLSPNGVLVDVGERVVRGQHIAVSGRSGQAGLTPHLHLQLDHCPGGAPPCSPLPLTFLNASPSVDGPLETGATYLALGGD